MNRFGLPLVPAALALIAVNFSDRFFLVHLASLAEVGLYEIGVRIASAMVLLLTAFRMAWPAFAYSIEDDDEAKRTYAFVLTYLVLVACWLALGARAARAVARAAADAAASSTQGERVVAPLAFGGVAYAAYIVMAIGVGRARRTQFNWVVTGVAALVNVALNLILIPPYGMMGAAVATVAAYVVMFVGMTWYAQRVFPVPYQWRRVLTAVAAALALLLLGAPARRLRRRARALARLPARAAAARLLPARGAPQPAGAGRPLAGDQAGRVHDRDPGEEAADREPGA